MGQKAVTEIGSEGNLAEYYEAALEFIDPALTADSSLADVTAAAARRRESLMLGPAPDANDQLGALSEALQFVQRVQTANQAAESSCPAPAGDSAAVQPKALPESTVQPLPTTEAEAALPETERVKGTSDRHQQSAVEFAGDETTGIAVEHMLPDQPGDPPAPHTQSTPDQPVPPEKPESNGEPGSASSTAEAASAPATGKADAGSGLDAPQKINGPAYRRNGMTLREVMAQAQLEAARSPIPAAKQEQQQPVAEARDRAKPPQLPETLAWPVVVGTALIAWQAWLAIFAGWTMTRFFAWPAPDYGYMIGRSQAILLAVVAVIIAVAVGKAVWTYRKQTRRLLWLVHASAVLVGLDLLAWWITSLNQDKLIPAPSVWYLTALVLGWLVAAGAAWLHDLRIYRYTPE